MNLISKRTYEPLLEIRDPRENPVKAFGWGFGKTADFSSAEHDVIMFLSTQFAGRNDFLNVMQAILPSLTSTAVVVHILGTLWKLPILRTQSGVQIVRDGPEWQALYLASPTIEELEDLSAQVQCRVEWSLFLGDSAQLNTGVLTMLEKTVLTRDMLVTCARSGIAFLYYNDDEFIGAVLPRGPVTNTMIEALCSANLAFMSRGTC